MICYGLVADWGEVRSWLQFLIILVTTTVGLLTFVRSVRQNQLSNAIKLVERFEGRFRGHDYDQFKKLVIASYVGTGVGRGNFVGPSGEKIEFDALFTEGSLDGNASTRTLQELDIICGEWLKRTVSKEYIYSNLGQLLEFYHWHLSEALELKDAYMNSWKNVYSVMEKNEEYRKKWSYRLLAVSEDAEEVLDENGVPLYEGRGQERWKV